MCLDKRIEGRCVYLARGVKSLTVKICDANNSRRDYAWVVRVRKPQDVTEDDIGRFSAIQDLIIWLKQEKS